MTKLINYSDFYYRTGYTFTFLDEILAYRNRGTYPIDRSNNRREALDRDLYMRSLLQNAMPEVRIWDIGIMLWPAGVGFKWHRDNHPTRGPRGVAMNLLLSTPVDNNYCEFSDGHPDDPGEKFKLPYKQYEITFLDTNQWHRVVNDSQVDRYVLTVGFDSFFKDPKFMISIWLEGYLFNSHYLKSIHV